MFAWRTFDYSYGFVPVAQINHVKPRTKIGSSFRIPLGRLYGFSLLDAPHSTPIIVPMIFPTCGALVQFGDAPAGPIKRKPGGAIGISLDCGAVQDTHGSKCELLPTITRLGLRVRVLRTSRTVAQLVRLLCSRGNGRTRRLDVGATGLDCSGRGRNQTWQNLKNQFAVVRLRRNQGTRTTSDLDKQFREREIVRRWGRR